MPNHPDGTVRGFKAAGCFFGDDDWCSAKLVSLLKKRLANLNLVDRLTDSDKVTNTVQLRYTLLRIVASDLLQNGAATH